MKTNYLFPNWCKKIGWFLFVPGAILGFVFFIYQFDAENNFLDESSSILAILGALFIAFSKEKSEDEFISKIRLKSLVWATYTNYAILILAILFVYDINFFFILIFNMFTLLVFFLIHFNWALYKLKNQTNDEE